MPDFIAHALAWLKVLFDPLSGRHRAGDRPRPDITPAASPARDRNAARLIAQSAHRREAPRGPNPALVRPYFTAHERHRAQPRRRRLLIASTAVDLAVAR